MTRHLLRLPATLVAVLVFAAIPAAVQDQGTPSTTGLVVSTSGLASDAGAGVLARGGNADDAAVATAFAPAVTHPSAGNIRRPAGRRAGARRLRGVREPGGGPDLARPARDRPLPRHARGLRQAGRR